MDSRAEFEVSVKEEWDDQFVFSPEIAGDLYQVIRHRLAWDAAIESGQIEKGERWS
jgi:hypothetical protein